MSETKKKDLWDKSQVLATFFVGIAGIFLTFTLQSQQEKNRLSQMTTQILTQREQNESVTVLANYGGNHSISHFHASTGFLGISVGSNDNATFADTHEISITLGKVKSDNAVEVTMKLDSDSPQEKRPPFEVSYFDTPFTDNTILPDGHRIALVLKEVSYRSHPHSAKLKLIEFPANYILSGYRPSLHQINKLLLSNQ